MSVYKDVGWIETRKFKVAHFVTSLVKSTRCGVSVSPDDCFANTRRPPCQRCELLVRGDIRRGFRSEIALPPVLSAGNSSNG